ncbi:MAG: FtsH protease activity modulator HflK [Deltaproteobacteria bacterium]|nr:FtsH protease activity modulator HflK [Deltaproteobacteria bacterium]
MNWDWEKLQKQNKQHGSQGGGPPPQFDEVLEKLKNLKFSGGPVLVVAIIVALLIASTTFYTVELDEVGIIQRFGKYLRTTNPGLNFKLPIGIEKVTKIKVKKVFKEEFGFRATRTMQSKFTSDKGNIEESLMLTGDLNVAVAPWIVQYKIKDPYNYLFKVDNVNDLLRDLAEASMRLVVGDRSINEVISRRQEIADEAELILQGELDDAETGIKVVTIEMKKTNVPGPVQASFNEVNQAVQEREKTIYEAKREYNKAIPAAKGEADRTIKKAEGYAIDLINRADGDASRFKALYAEYSKAKDITKRRIYLEKLKELFPKLGKKYIIDSDQKNVLPLLNLGQQNGVLK